MVADLVSTHSVAQKRVAIVDVGGAAAIAVFEPAFGNPAQRAVLAASRGKSGYRAFNSVGAIACSKRHSERLQVRRFRR
jgi:hypothetical protein